MNDNTKNPFSPNSIEGIDHEIKNLDGQRGKLLDERYPEQRVNLVNRKAALLKSAGQLHDVDADGYVHEAPATRTIDSIHATIPTTFEAIDRQIEMHKSAPILNHDRLAQLYSRKAQLMQSRGLLEIHEDDFTNQVVAVKSSPIPVSQKINLADVDDAITREREKDFTDPDVLGQLYAQKAEFMKASGTLEESSSDSEDGGFSSQSSPSKEDEVTSSLQSHWGAEYDLNSYELVANVRDSAAMINVSKKLSANYRRTSRLRLHSLLKGLRLIQSLRCIITLRAV